MGGRWNSRGKRVIYAAEHLSLAILEYLVNAQSDDVPAHYGRVEITLPGGVSAIRVVGDDRYAISRWDRERSRRLGDQWLESQKSLLLFVPAIPAEGMEENVLINPHHPDLASLLPSEPQPIRWDQRLFPRATNAR